MLTNQMLSKIDDFGFENDNFSVKKVVSKLVIKLCLFMLV